MASIKNVELARSVLRDALGLGGRADRLGPDSPVLGGIPEFDSMAVVTVVALIEERLCVSIDDDDLTADVFSTVGTLADFIGERTGN